MSKSAMTNTKSARSVSVDEASERFLKVLSEVEKGTRFVVTKNHRPVARIEPIENAVEVPESRRKAAIERLKKIMAAGRRSKSGWDYTGRREDLHDRSV